MKSRKREMREPNRETKWFSSKGTLKESKTQGRVIKDRPHLQNLLLYRVKRRGFSLGCLVDRIVNL